ncbi:TPA: ParB N-terminal domain-containing protein, partial [Salmonella enterica]|nr:ParB N-terminal domain-containing protein [Salmonella enterica]
MSVPLDQLRAFDLNPRITRNPNYDEIKESIRNRGLDHPPQITQRPGEKFYIIASGGNTRLAVLNELWLETHDKKYWNVACLFRPWTSASLAQGNLHCLLGHLVENELRGSLTFIERALAIQNVIRIYKDMDSENSQRDLVQILRQNGYVISQAQLSVMSSTIELLLPYIPDLLYGGLSWRNTGRLLTLRANTERFWNKHCETLSPETEQHLPLFDDIFAMA